jgi:hypothetical protein
MPRLCHTVEEILAKLREAEVAMSKGRPWLTSAVRSVSPNKLTIVGATNMAASRWIKSSGSKTWNGRTPA